MCVEIAMLIVLFAGLWLAFAVLGCTIPVGRAPTAIGQFLQILCSLILTFLCGVSLRRFLMSKAVRPVELGVGECAVFAAGESYGLPGFSGFPAFLVPASYILVLPDDIATTGAQKAMVVISHTFGGPGTF